jgi:hypothetical protein
MTTKRRGRNAGGASPAPTVGEGGAEKPHAQRRRMGHPVQENAEPSFVRMTTLTEERRKCRAFAALRMTTKRRGRTAGGASPAPTTAQTERETEGKKQQANPIKIRSRRAPQILHGGPRLDRGLQDDSEESVGRGTGAASGAPTDGEGRGRKAPRAGSAHGAPGARCHLWRSHCSSEFSAF